MQDVKLEDDVLKLFFKKQLQIESLIYDYLDNLKMAEQHFSEALNSCLKDGICGDFDFLTAQTHKFESKADDIREEIKALMYGKALIPESRGDIMGLLESIDEIPRVFELILHMIKTQKLVIPEFIVSDIQELIKISLDSCDLLFKQTDALFKKSEELRSLVSTIDHNESHCDHIERRIITKVFDSDVDPFQKLQLKELIIHMGEISDQADRVSKRINIISLKRHV
jgi:predicted phosphate transport protein (TIGR00153 family)